METSVLFLIHSVPGSHQNVLQVIADQDIFHDNEQ